MEKTLQALMNKSEDNLKGLEESVELATRKLIELSWKLYGIEIRITQGLRTIDYQNELYAQGRSKPGPIVTNAKGGSSRHNYGQAVDFVLIKGGYDLKYDANGDNKSDWFQVVDLAVELGFEAGAYWTKAKEGIVDYPHFQISYGLSITDLKNGKKPTKAKVTAAIKKIEKVYEEKTAPPKEASTVIDVLVNGKAVDQGILVDNKAYAPLRVVGDALSVPVSWDNINKTAFVNGRSVQDVKLLDNKAYVQLRAIGEAFGARITWENKSKTAGVIKDGK